MSNIRFHPTDDILACYSAGELDPASSIMLSAHLELCSHCRARVAELENNQAQELALVPSETPSEALSEELNDLLDNILSQDEVPQDDVVAATIAHIEINNKQFRLPRALQRHEDHIGPWSRLPGNIKRASVTTGGHSKMNFIYMDCNSSLPQHTHQGQEITLVLAGEFMDEHATYKPGDFIVQTSAHHHAPKTRADQDCLCLTLLDAPLHFTNGLATLLNPFSQLFFR
ncbi:ChrR family anti-sigma-E factor [Photobacterium sp. OFAV2-7]|uniref:ChrR family anti-sigma-E factor n=1 Tax=Photobacterium sp. OFAV2-7 TaxID=2917748 RepID=UPI001EF4018B|nr:ChrR family anti-sigma-E factor [Photobacterium sp. OFAV2-7]MCG7585149.1 ChrR family anti-sigma-E factor [Photobacterium sp. OFAV2-7]